MSMRESVENTDKYQFPHLDIFLQIGVSYCYKKKFRKYETLHLYVISQMCPTLCGFRGVAAQ